VANCIIPIISGVGHETDITICDLVADLRAPTPTAAAELVAKGSIELLDKWTNLHRMLNQSIGDKLLRARRELTRLSPINALNRYQDRLALASVNVSRRKQHLTNRIERILDSRMHRLSQLSQKLQALVPSNVMARGFSVLRTKEGKVIFKAADLHPGDQVEVLLQSGKVNLKVESTLDEW
jgi:exodeoxyribonuclease VII large subunit